MSAPTPDQDPTTHVIQVQAARQHGLRHAALAVGLAGATLAAALAVTDRFGITDVLPDINLEKLKLPTPEDKPPEVEATIIESTYTIEQKFEVQCLGRISVGVGVKGDIGGLVGKAKIDKIKFGDFLACGTTGTTSADVTIHRTKRTNPVTNQTTDDITKVVYDGPGLSVTQPRVDKTDDRNCVDLGTGDNQKKIDKEIAKRQVKKANGKKLDCDKGLSETFFYATFDEEAAVRLNDTADAAAQIAMAADANVPEVANELNVQYGSNLKKALENEFPKVPVEVNISNQNTADRQLKEATEQLKGSQYSVLPVLNKAGDAVEKLEITSIDGSKITITLKTLHTEGLSIVGLNKIGLPTLVPSSSVPAQGTRG